MKALLRLSLLSLVCSGAASQADRNPGSVLLTVVDSTPVTYRSQIAYFGDPFQDDPAMEANFMIPPDDATLCDYPPSLLNISFEEAQNFTTSKTRPIALFVSRGNCSFDQKARVALAMQQNLNKLLKYMVVYNNNFSTPNDLVVMSTSATGPSYEELDGMNFVFVSTNTGLSLMKKIRNQENLTNQDATYLKDNNSEWYLPLFLEVDHSRSSNGGSDVQSNDSSTSARNTFYWLRFVLFTLLIVSPCARAGYLWHAAGGRFLWRRNENGWITGVQYMRPIPYWFASGVEVNHQDEHTTTRMTEEEVNALPEIFYQFRDEDEEKYKKEEDANSDGNVSTARTKESSDSEIESIDIEHAHEDQMLDQPEEILDAIEETKGAKEETKGKEDSSSAGTVLENHPPATELAAPTLITTCTMCSICIDEFENGEKIRILPKCRHGFHIDCIKPWLTERQSCCPLCKTNVLPMNDDVEQQGNNHAPESAA